MTSPVGVFIPTYNAGEFLNTAIHSVLTQSLSSFDLLILDDASTDNTPHIIQQYLAHPQITYIRNKTNLGMARNWNKGISLLNNKFIAKLDADDYYHPHFLSEMVSALENNPSVGLTFCAVNWITGASSREIRPYTSSWVTDGHIFLQNLSRKFVTHSATICVHRKCYDQLGGFVEQMRIHADWEMWTRISTHYDVAYVNKTLASMVRHPKSCTSQSREDTRSPDDLEIWLELLDKNELPYHLSEKERLVLEAAMVRKINRLLKRAVTLESYKTAKACAEFLIKRRPVPVYEKMRYRLLIQLLDHSPHKANTILRGSRWTERIWSLERFLSIQLPARDPYEALTE